MPRGRPERPESFPRCFAASFRSSWWHNCSWPPCRIGRNRANGLHISLPEGRALMPGHIYCRDSPLHCASGLEDTFDESSITYLEDSTEAQSGDKVNFTSLPENIRSEYGELLYQNQDGTYSTVLHSSGQASDTYYIKDYILKSFVAYSAEYSGTSIFSWQCDTGA